MIKICSKFDGRLINGVPQFETWISSVLNLTFTESSRGSDGLWGKSVQPVSSAAVKLFKCSFSTKLFDPTLTFEKKFFVVVVVFRRRHRRCRRRRRFHRRRRRRRRLKFFRTFERLLNEKRRILKKRPEDAVEGFSFGTKAT